LDAGIDSGSGEVVGVGVSTGAVSVDVAGVGVSIGAVFVDVEGIGVSTGAGISLVQPGVPSDNKMPDTIMSRIHAILVFFFIILLTRINDRKQILRYH